MNAKRKPNPPSAEMLRALDEAKRIREQRYAHKDKRIRSMVADGVPKRDIETALRVSHQYILKVLARPEPQS